MSDRMADERVELIPCVTVPPGRSGNWAVERFTVSKDEADIENMRAMFGGGRPINPSAYTRLMRGGTVVMSDTPAEKRDHFSPVLKASGHCLVNGLGIGMVLNAMLLKPDVTRVTVVEKSADVIALVGPHYQALYGLRVEIVNADAFEYSPPRGAKYGVVWHDIWDDICPDNLEGMQALHRKYGRRANWQGSWCRHFCERGRRYG